MCTRQKGDIIPAGDQRAEYALEFFNERVVFAIEVFPEQQGERRIVNVL